MPKYKVNVTGPNDAADVTHLTVDTDIANGTTVKRSSAVNSGNAGVAPISNAATNTRKAALAQAAASAAAALRNVKQKSNANAKLAANNVQALIVVKQKALQTANAAHTKAVSEAEDAEAVAVAAETAAEAADAAAKKMEWALLTRNATKKAEAEQLAKDAEALRSQAIAARSDEQSKRPSVKKTQQQVELATAELKEVETKKAVINAEQHAKATKKAAESVQNSQTPALVNAAVAAEAAAQQAREAANQASVEAGKQREAKPFLEPRKEPNVVFPEPYVAPIVPRSNPESVRVSRSNQARRNRNKARLNAAATRKANNIERAAATQRAKNTETLTKGETPVTNQALANKAAARRSRNMSARAPPPPSNFALGKAAPQSMPQLAPGSRLPPLNRQAVVPELQSFPKPPAWNPPPLGQTLPPAPQTRSEKSTLMRGSTNQLGNMAQGVDDNAEEESTAVMPAPSAQPANNDEFPNIATDSNIQQSSPPTQPFRIPRRSALSANAPTTSARRKPSNPQGGRRTHRKQSTHRKHGKRNNKSKKRK